MERLKVAGIKIKNEKQTIIEIAEENALTPKQVYMNMKPAGLHGKLRTLPDTPKPGLGKRTLADICNEYDLNMELVIRKLADNNINATAGMTFKEIADLNKNNPIDTYDILKKISSLDLL
ncbi:MAG: hypothetical protein SV375_08005 [Thermodesulfobacteriota bacterium]|nr:hypothetical protein [Thermodesulfobacteriota bacterium]